jgi:hypothetical protein
MGTELTPDHRNAAENPIRIIPLHFAADDQTGRLVMIYATAAQSTAPPSSKLGPPHRSRFC